MKKEQTIALLIITITGLFLVMLSGSVFSGYHFMDCSAYIKYKRELSEMSGWECLTTCIANESGIRFRPIWHLNTLFKTWLWGDNMLLQGFWQLFQNSIAAFLIYCLGRRIQWTHKESLLFAGIGLIGTQSAIFYQTLAIETPALITLLLSWHFVLIYFDTQGNRKILPYWGFIAFSLFAALMKENFILVLPASYLFFCLQYKEKYQTGFRETLFHTWETGLILFLLIVSGLWAVLAFAGSDFGYAGMGRFTSFFPYVKSAVYLYGISGCAFAILIAVYLFLNKRGDWKVWLFPTLFFLAITVPQIIIYSKSNIVDRYLIPAVIGCAYFSVFVFRELKKRDQSINEFLWKNISLLLGLFLLIFCSFVVFNKTFQQELIRFAVRMQGEVVQTMTSVSSLHYLQNTLVIIGITGLIASGVLLVMGFLRNHSFLRKLSQLYSSALLLILFLNGGLAFASCKRYAMRGFATENFLKTIINTTQPTDTLLIVGNPLVDMEGMGSGIGEYLQKHNRKNLRVCPVTRTPVEEEFIPFLLDFYRQKDLDTQTDKQSIKAIAVFPGSENLFENSMDWFDADLFNRYEFTGNYVVYVKQH